MPSKSKELHADHRHHAAPKLSKFLLFTSSLTTSTAASAIRLAPEWTCGHFDPPYCQSSTTSSARLPRKRLESAAPSHSIQVDLLLHVAQHRTPVHRLQQPTVCIKSCSVESCNAARRLETAEPRRLFLSEGSARSDASHYGDAYLTARGLPREFLCQTLCHGGFFFDALPCEWSELQKIFFLWPQFIATVLSMRWAGSCLRQSYVGLGMFQRKTFCRPGDAERKNSIPDKHDMETNRFDHMVVLVMRADALGDTNHHFGSVTFATISTSCLLCYSTTRPKAVDRRPRTMSHLSKRTTQSRESR